jgi:hypothetical protein
MPQFITISLVYHTSYFVRETVANDITNEKATIFAKKTIEKKERMEVTEHMPPLCIDSNPSSQHFSNEIPNQ